ncbi:MAG: hypothetical protein ACRDP6_37165 [Actinoallomurus sp.]
MADEIEYGEFWLPGGSDGHPDNPLAVCGRCSAIVLATTVHSRWHAELASAAANPWPWQCESCGGNVVRDGEMWRHAAGPGCDFLLPPAAAADAGKPEPKQFEIWEFDDGEIGRLSWAKDPDGNLSLAAATDGPGWTIWEAWRGDANERTPLRKIGETVRLPGEVSR